jgi:hypothetical protein
VDRRPGGLSGIRAEIRLDIARIERIEAVKTAAAVVWTCEADAPS